MISTAAPRARRSTSSKSINFVTTAGPCFVVLGFDEAKVKAAVADVYKDTLLELDEEATGAIEKPKKDDLFNFATRYLEKLIQLVVPVPRGADDTVEKILGLKPLPQPSRWNRRLRNARRIAGDLVVMGLIVALTGMALWYGAGLAGRGIATWQASIVAANPPEPATSPGATEPATPPGGPAPSSGEAPAQSAEPTAPVAEGPAIDPLDLVAWPPWAPPLAALLLVALLASIFVPRFFSEAVVDDSTSFLEALVIWAPVIARQRQTPRAIKRFVNRLRFLAMRIRDLGDEATAQGREVPIDEPTLVTFAAIEEVDEDRFGRPMNGSGSSGADIDSAVLGGLAVFAERFGRRPDDNSDALQAYRAIAGIVEERSGELRPADKPPDAKPPDANPVRKPPRKTRPDAPQSCGSSSSRRSVIRSRRRRARGTEPRGERVGEEMEHRQHRRVRGLRARRRDVADERRRAMAARAGGVGRVGDDEGRRAGSSGRNRGSRRSPSAMAGAR